MNNNFRPHKHFTPKAHWLNDPNGLVYLDGEYHLFYQYYPYSEIWGPMHWGHAVSKNLIDWTELDVALEPYGDTMIFSGSAVIDVNNTAGFGYGVDGVPPMVLIYTSHWEKDGVIVESQSLAYSLDRGRTFTYYSKENPVLQNPGIRDFRDPKVMWYEGKLESYWVMTVVATNKVYFYKSTNLIDWTLLSEFGEEHGAHGGVWECPDLIRFGEEWVLLVSVIAGAPNGGSAMQYFVGTFDGVKFVNANPPSEVRWLDFGTDYYAGVTWSNMPDERIVMIAWMNNWEYARETPSVGFRGVMTFPRELQLVDGVLMQRWVRELEPRRQPSDLDGHELNSEAAYVIAVEAVVQRDERLQIVIQHSESEQTLIMIASEGQLTFDRTQSGMVNFHESFKKIHYAPFPLLEGGKVQLELLLDRSSIEIIAQNGTFAMTEQLFPANYLKVEVKGASKEVIKELNRII